MIFDAIKGYLAIGVLTVVLTLGGLAVYKYNSMSSSLESAVAQVEQLESELKDCKDKWQGLKSHVEQQNAGIQEIKSENDKLKVAVEASVDRISSLRRQRDKALDQLGKMPIGATCGDKIDWLRDQAKELTQ